MAALSCYQPCRSHLAQPARCLNDDQEIQRGSLSFRRRQFIERCHEAREVRYRDPIPAEVSVRKTREELTKNAVQAVPSNRRLTVESSWSKVEEVRKKFERASNPESFSRSFESPPRRRLADSLFASFKLPRRREGMAQPRSLVMTQPQPKRKSAVELLAETKAFYVKSETVLDRKQELPLRVSSGLSQAIAAGGCHVISSGTLHNNDACCNQYSTPRAIGTARRAVSAGEGLQNTLRRLLEHSDSRENVYSPPIYAVPHKLFTETRRVKETYNDPTANRSVHTSGTFSGTSSSGTSGSKPQVRSDPEHARDCKRPLSFGDARVFFPESFVIPRQRPSEVVVKNNYSIPSSHSSPENIELPDPVLSPEGDARCEEVGAISPPAQYAYSTQSRHIRSRNPYNSHKEERARRQVFLKWKRELRVEFQGRVTFRSNSQCQGTTRDESSNNINSHKSLPDLHTHARCYTEHVNTSVTDTIGRSPRRRRHTAHHQRTASCSSKGTRSNHSSLLSSCEAFSEHPSPGEETYQYNSRCGSSFARDSGGSSGHYTQRSAPAHTAHRTDSGSSTQHEHRYGPYYLEENPGEWVSAPPQFQDGAPSPPVAPRYSVQHSHPAPIVGIHFQASAPPPQFQDEPPMYEYEGCGYKTPKKCMPVGKKEYIHREYTRFHEPNTELICKQPQYQEVRMQRVRVEGQEYVNTVQLCPPEEVTSPLGTFKRQRCLRYKQRRPRPILRSKSDISDRYRGNDGHSPASAPCEGDVSPESLDDEPSRLNRFFEYLGLEERIFYSIVSESPTESPVFFSDASTVDSNQLAADYTVHGPPQPQMYRNTEPPSVVERNARIVKWLCNCRKTQLPQQ